MQNLKKKIKVKEDLQCNTDSVYRKDENYYPQVFLERYFFNLDPDVFQCKF